MKKKEFYLNCVLLMTKASLEKRQEVDIDLCAQSALDIIDAANEKWTKKYGTPLFE